MYTDKGGLKIYAYLPAPDHLEEFTGVDLNSQNYHTFRTEILPGAFPNGTSDTSIVVSGQNALKNELDENGKYSWSSADEDTWGDPDLEREEKIHILLEKYLSDFLSPEVRHELIYDSTWIFDEANQEMILMHKEPRTAYHYSNSHLLKQAENFGARAPFDFTQFKDTDDRHAVLEQEQIHDTDQEENPATIRLHK